MAKRLAPRPTPGRIVHYVVAAGRTAGAHRPALVIDTAGEHGLGDWNVNLRVYFKPNDEPGLSNVKDEQAYVASVPPDNSAIGNAHKPGSWHWPERED